MRIVILRALKLGDFLTGIPAYRAIRAAFPRAAIALAAPAIFSPLVPLLNGALDEVIDQANLLTPNPRARGADLGVNLHGAGPQSHQWLLAADVARLIAFAHPGIVQTARAPVFDPNEHEVARWCRLLEAAGIAADPTALDLAYPTVTVPRRVRGATLIHPGAASAARRWPIERWIAVVRAERARGRGVIITSGPQEVGLALAIAASARLPLAHVYAGRTTVLELAALVAHAGRVVCGDTGVAHLATALRRPSVLLFGPTPPATWGPPVRPYHRVLWNGSVGDPHADQLDAGLDAIEAATVIAELDALAVATARTSRATA